LTLLAAPLKEVVTTIKHPDLIQWATDCPAYQEKTQPFPTTVAAQDQLLAFIGLLGEQLVDVAVRGEVTRPSKDDDIHDPEDPPSLPRLSSPTPADSTLPPSSTNPSPSTALTQALPALRLFLVRVYYARRDYRRCLRYFAAAMANHTWSDPDTLIAGLPSPWDDRYLVPAVVACAELNQPFSAVLVGQLMRSPDYTLLFPLLDKVLARSALLAEYPWELLWDMGLLEYIIYNLTRNNQEALARKL
ncbi:hypothetical protein IWQ60_012616, partial [Tieghemiomyces parasiticus]